MISLSDAQLQTVMLAAGALPPEKRGVYLQRIAATLIRCGRYTDHDVAVAAQSALRGLVQQPTAAA
jgi:hypothetical protein